MASQNRFRMNTHFNSALDVVLKSSHASLRHYSAAADGRSRCEAAPGDGGGSSGEQ